MGESFTAKFERLIYNAYMMVEAKEQEAEQLNQLIMQRRKELLGLEKDYRKLRSDVNIIQSRIDGVLDYFKDV